MRTQLTARMSEGYTKSKAQAAPGYVGDLLDITGMKQIQITRHKIRIRKLNEVEWAGIQIPAETILKREWPSESIKSLNEFKDPRKRFSLPQGFRVDQRMVFEGVNHASSHPIARDLYTISGITTLILAGNEIVVKRSPCFTWSELAPQIQSMLEKLKPEK